MLRVENLTFSYHKKGPPVLEDVSFQIAPGSLVAVLGANGAGKSTLFQCILGFLRGYHGRITMNGIDIRSLQRREMAKLAAYIPQSEAPVYNYTVLDSVLMGTTGTLSPLRSPGAEQLARAEEALGFLGISGLSQRGINELSGGERQLVLLARAIAQQARLLIMDEPTASLDYGNQQLVLQQVQNMARSGYTVLLSTHNPEHAIQYASDILALKNHRILAEGPADTVLSEALIQTLYGLQVRLVSTDIDGRTVKSCIPVSSPAARTKLQQERGDGSW